MKKLTRRRINQLEHKRGKPPTVDEMIVLARALKVNPLWLSFGEEPMEIGVDERPFFEARYRERVR